MSDVKRGRNLVRHRYVSGSRGPPPSSAKPSPSTGTTKPPSAGLGDAKPKDETEVFHMDLKPTRIIDITKPRDLHSLPILVTKEDLSDIQSTPDADSTKYEVLIVESAVPNDKDDTLLPRDVDEFIVQELIPRAIPAGALTGPLGIEDSNELADALITGGGFIALPGVPKPNAVLGIGAAKTGDIIKSLNQGDYRGAVIDASPIVGLTTDEQSGAIDRFVKSIGIIGALASGQQGALTSNLSTPAPDATERKPSGHIEAIGNEIADHAPIVGEGIVTGFTNLDKLGEGLNVLGGVFSAASKFDNMSNYVTSLPGVREVESDRYYTVYFYPRKGITYIEWKPTEDIRNLFSRSRFKNTMREWSEDFIAAAGFKVPAWSRRVKYILNKYGPDSKTVVHYGYSRGGGIATHMGGTGYGTGYFPSYAPSRKSRSKLSGDMLHDLIINPMSYMLLLRRRIA